MADLGQVFTRQVVANYMTSLFGLSKTDLILDPCFGDGVFLRALQENDFINVTGCEIDEKLFCLHQDQFDDYELFNQDFLKFGVKESFDGIIMNPPYIRQEKIDDLECYGITKKILRQNAIFQSLPTTANMYMYFIMKAVDLLRDNGEMVVIFPSSWLNALSGKEFKKVLLEKGKFEKIIYLHGDVFEKEALVDVVIIKVIKTTRFIETSEEYMEIQNNSIIPLVLHEEVDIEPFSYPFSELATVQRGVTTGYNKMFINPEIDKDSNTECLKNIISSPKNVIGYSTENAKLDLLLDCDENEISKQLRMYLKKWEEKILLEQKPKTLFNKIKKGENWCVIRQISSKGIIFSYFVRNDMKFILNNSDTLVRDNFYIIRPNIDFMLMMALLNNYYTFYQLELLGKKYGAGLLKLQRYDLERLKFPNIEELSASDIVELKELAEALIDSGDSRLIDELTKALSRYSSIDFETIRKKYLGLKKQRLEAS